MFDKIDFYAPLELEDGRTIYGAAAMNKRVKNAGNLNQLATNLVMVGYQTAIKQAAAATKNKIRK